MSQFADTVIILAQDRNYPQQKGSHRFDCVTFLTFGWRKIQMYIGYKSANHILMSWVKGQGNCQMWVAPGWNALRCLVDTGSGLLYLICTYCILSGCITTLTECTGWPRQQDKPMTSVGVMLHAVIMEIKWQLVFTVENILKYTDKCAPRNLKFSPVWLVQVTMESSHSEPPDDQTPFTGEDNTCISKTDGKGRLHAKLRKFCDKLKTDRPYRRKCSLTMNLISSFFIYVCIHIGIKTFI